MTFQKGHKINNGRIHGKEMREKLSKSLKEAYIKNPQLALNTSKRKKGIKTGIVPRSAFKKGHVGWNKGGTNLKLLGANNPRWKGDKSYTEKRRTFMSRTAYKDFRKEVFERDDYTCKGCNKRGRETGYSLEVHHLISFRECMEIAVPQLTMEPNNAVTMCKGCHRQTENYGQKGVNDVKGYS